MARIDLTERAFPYWIVIARLGQRGPLAHRVSAPTAVMAQTAVERSGALVYSVAEEVYHRYGEEILSTLTPVALNGTKAN